MRSLRLALHHTIGDAIVFIPLTSADRGVSERLVAPDDIPDDRTDGSGASRKNLSRVFWPGPRAGPDASHCNHGDLPTLAAIRGRRCATMAAIAASFNIDMGFLADLGSWWRWRMRRAKVHIYGVAEYRNTGTIVGRQGSHWSVEDDQGRVVYAQEAGSPLDLKIGDRVEFEPMFQSTAASRLSNRLWTIVRKVQQQL